MVKEPFTERNAHKKYMEEVQSAMTFKIIPKYFGHILRANDKKHMMSPHWGMQMVSFTMTAVPRWRSWMSSLSQPIQRKTFPRSHVKVQVIILPWILSRCSARVSTPQRPRDTQSNRSWLHPCIHPEKTTADQIAPILTRLYQFSLDLGKVLTYWKNAHIVPIYIHLPSNYHPVSLPSAVYKVLEHVVHSSVLDHFDRHRIPTDNKHVFRARRSCETQLITTILKIARFISKRGQVDVILLDFTKAFDKVPHQRLLHKLDYYNVWNSTLHWIESFLSNRKQSVLLKGTRSSE